MRESGILLHISSLPGSGGIGSLGREAFAFVDFLKAAGMTLWQVLPVGPTGYGESPYQSSSAFAGNPLLLNCETLYEEGLLDERTALTQSQSQVDYDAVRADKERLLRRCYEMSRVACLKEVEAFRAQQHWVEDFGLFTALKAHFGGVKWTDWPDEAIRLRRPEAMKKYRVQLQDEIDYHIFIQYLFRKQWFALKQYANKQGVRLFGDMPIYVAEDSADTWTHPEVFQLDKNRLPKRVAGVPPDYFSADGQLWGNPLYRWNYLRLHGYRWWVERMRGMTELYDLIRIDHFIGFANYYSIPFGAPNARGGKWIIGPGKALFRTLEKQIPSLHIIAEDLGEVNDRVRRLLKWCGYPGMRVLCFGFDGDDASGDLPHNYVENCVAYTGTHDNDTVRGWWDNANEKAKEHAKALLHIHTDQEAAPAFIRAVMESCANTCVIPMQDVLGLDHSARMNLPGTIGGNWLWRMLPGAATPEKALTLHELNNACHRGTQA